MCVCVCVTRLSSLCNSTPTKLYMTVAILTSVTTIGYYALNSCSSLISISIPNTVTSIGRATFNFCTSMKTVITYLQ